ncbi:helix-turn-helix transcriptional regulator [Amycolatopsis sp. QT-25]|uniref:helix-turn-helix domain-containing protein n=1 Tax=Amycolatopsis sp. QT-25 TaxID=3034022 RepID=UPI0023EB29A1|nr:helix-turn-helix transcriptional regulator [Amycolatopsis sp. QT-25]WET81691.1 helix-turn-helix transcriptional regulator [Amycolatopsis sp. QT-25]
MDVSSTRGELAHLLVALKERSGLSYSDLGRKSHISSSTLHRYCSGVTVPPDYRTIAAIATACEATDQDLADLLRRWHVANGQVAVETPVCSVETAAPASGSGRRRPRSLAAAAAVLVAIVIPSSMAFNDADPSTPVPAAAPADAGIRYDFAPRRILAPRMPKAVPGGSGKPDHEVVALGSVELEMSTTQTAYVVSVMRASSATYRSLFENEVRCRWPGGEQNFVTGQNILQEGASSEREKEEVQLTTRFLLHPGVATTVACTAYVRAAALREDLDARFRLDSGRIEVADTSVDNMTTGVPAQRAVPRGLLRVGPDPSVMVREPQLPPFTFAPGFTHLSVVADTQYQACHPQEDNHCDTPTPTASTATFTLYVTQWKGNEVCHKNRATGELREMSYAVHHHHVPLHLPHFTIRADCDPRFSAYVLVKWIDGMGGGVQGAVEGLTDSRGSTSTHNASTSHIFMVPYKG